MHLHEIRLETCANHTSFGSIWFCDAQCEINRLRAFTPALGALAPMMSGKTLAVFAESGLNVGLGIALIAYRQRSRASCVDGARSGFECCFRDFGIRPSMEKPSAGMSVALSSLAFQDRDIQPEAWRHVQILRENAQQPQGQLVLCKNPERWQYHALLQGGASRSSRKSCSKTGDGFLL